VLQNRSIPRATVIPVLPYPDVGAAVDWLCAAFGFTLRLRIGDHRAQLNVGDGAVVVAEGGKQPGSHWVMVRVEDIDALCDRAVAHGAHLLQSPTDQPYGERQAALSDLAGHRWTFSQSIADVAPETWGGTPGQL
jgi:uncharacterized glyoxalase superfamily protein PhnB